MTHWNFWVNSDFVYKKLKYGFNAFDYCCIEICINRLFIIYYDSFYNLWKKVDLKSIFLAYSLKSPFYAELIILKPHNLTLKTHFLLQKIAILGNSFYQYTIDRSLGKTFIDFQNPWSSLKGNFIQNIYWFIHLKKIMTLFQKLSIFH